MMTSTSRKGVGLKALAIIFVVVTLLYVGIQRVYKHIHFGDCHLVACTTADILSDAVQHIVFIKTHKTGSSTTSAIINRYGLNMNLSFVINKNNWPSGNINFMSLSEDSVQTTFLPPRSKPSGGWKEYTYDICAVHARYFRSAFESFMPPDTRYVTILREPVSQFESAFHFFMFGNVVTGNHARDVFNEFLRAPKFYREQLNRERWLLSRNSQLYDLGLDHCFHDNETIVTDHIKMLQETLDLVLIVEYYDESLILLKKLMNWTFDDIVYIPQNERHCRLEIDLSMRVKIQNWNSVDKRLYDTFNKTFWDKVRDYGPSFDEDLRLFREKKDDVMTKCVDEVTVQKNWRNEPIIVYKSTYDTATCCRPFLMTYNEYEKCIWREQY
ncbi:galactose-3-O-sulfotransferase 3-like [Ptychodera flava]|uniref:galactose-3-O-sulfotransferase 3-like n=1 Tax=Ptychodera flava TaxID=63121 RepID=UPI00396AB108